MKAGSCTFRDGMTFHFAHANSTDKPRGRLR
ncbi:phytanoyl-CoA dioxygenase family protein [Paenibacillus sp. OV219]